MWKRKVQWKSEDDVKWKRMSHRYSGSHFPPVEIPVLECSVNHPARKGWARALSSSYLRLQAGYSIPFRKTSSAFKFCSLNSVCLLLTHLSFPFTHQHFLSPSAVFCPFQTGKFLKPNNRSCSIWMCPAPPCQNLSQGDTQSTWLGLNYLTCLLSLWIKVLFQSARFGGQYLNQWSASDFLARVCFTGRRMKQPHLGVWFEGFRNILLPSPSAIPPSHTFSLMVLILVKIQIHLEA